MALPFAAIAQSPADNTLQPVTVKAEKAPATLGASHVAADAIQATRRASSDSANLLRSLPASASKVRAGSQACPACTA